jgi:hypothetical protein
VRHSLEYRFMAMHKSKTAEAGSFRARFSRAAQRSMTSEMIVGWSTRARVSSERWALGVSSRLIGRILSAMR